VIFLVVAVNLLIFRRLIPAHVQATQAIATPLLPVQIARYVAGDYASSLIGLAVSLALPLMVISHAGAEANAYYSLAWTVTYALYLVGQNMGMSLIAEAVTEPEKFRAYARQTLLQAMRLVVPVILVIEIIAPYFLHFFGQNYVVEGTTLLRLLALSAIPNTLNDLYISMARVHRNTRTVILLQCCIDLPVLVLSYFLLQRYGLVGIGYAWLISQSVGAILLSTGAFQKFGCPSLSSILHADRSQLLAEARPAPERESEERP
jgi:Na+-driven multidrug efflux pump